MLIPKKVKYRKEQDGGKIKGLSQRGNYLAFGSYGIKALEKGKINSRQIEASRRVILRYFKGKGKIWIRIFPQKPVTKKPDETGMGGGKGSVEYYAFIVKPGRIIFEVDGLGRDLSIQALKEASRKIPFKTKIVEGKIK
ncbi:MAG: 50S ribosomal protein L16 [Candidatus Pacebacteria bacterium]|nr:50S ribosomal protein L16 [Candidatus Paceibacterota bacterium]